MINNHFIKNKIKHKICELKLLILILYKYIMGIKIININNI